MRDRFVSLRACVCVCARVRLRVYKEGVQIHMCMFARPYGFDLLFVFFSWFLCVVSLLFMFIHLFCSYGLWLGHCPSSIVSLYSP